MKRKPNPAALAAMQESAQTLKTIARGRRKSLQKMNDAELCDELSRIVGKITAATDKFAAACSLLPADELAEWDRDFDQWQRDEQTVWEIVCSRTGNIVTRHWYAIDAANCLQQEMIDRDGCEPGEYFIRERQCKLQPVS